MAVHLFVRSCYTLLASTIRIPQLVHTVKKLGFSTVALTDHNVMHGVPEFLHVCKEEGIKPIIGLEADVLYHEETVPFLLLAEDGEGYASLLKLSSYLKTENKPLDVEMLKKCMHCLLIAYGEGGWMDSELVQNDREGVKGKLGIMKEELPSFDIALSYQEASLWKERNALLKRIASGMGIHTVALNKVYYLQEKDAEALKLVNAIRTDKTFQDDSLLNITGRHLLAKPEFEALYNRDDIERTDYLASLCTGEYTLPSAHLPEYPLKEGVSSRMYLEALCHAGLNKRLHGNVSEVYGERLRYELSVIEKMHFEDYFLIVYDFILYARKHGIYVGPGRGSACGSLTAWSLGITEIDPLKYHLLFERFLNPERVSMPDIDTDFPDNRRDEVKQYVYDKYGHDHTADIVTFSTIGARQAVMDTAKVLSLNNREVEILLRQIPRDTPGKKTTLAGAWKENTRLREVVSADEKYKKVLHLASLIEGLPRNYSVHAAGMILSDRKLTDIIPVMNLEGNDIHLSQYAAGYLEERGLIKIDFLSLRNLSVISDISEEVKKSDPSFNILHIPMDDPKTYQVFARGDTIGIFQFEGEGMKSLLKRMKPVSIEEIAAALALYRPGPMGSIDAYLANRADPSRIVYPLDCLKPILEETYGIIIYQEQIMMIAQKAAGFSLGKADILRRAISKKKVDQMKSMRTAFLDGCRKNHVDEKTAENLFGLIEKFAGYGFNKSHAVAYSVVAYQLAYLKAEYPLAFYCALLTSVIGDENKTAAYIAECRRRKIKIEGPDINRSKDRAYVENDAVILPLSMISSIGMNTAAMIVKDRQEHGQYIDFYDFAARMNALKIDRTKMENMIDAGALDCFDMGRRSLLYAMDEALQYAQLVTIDDGQMMRLDLGLVSKPVMKRMKDDPQEKSEREKKALGFNIGTPPIVLLKQQYHIEVPTLAELHDARGYVRGCALISRVKKIRTKKGEPMAFVSLSDESGEGDITVMPRQYAQYQKILVNGAVIAFEGRQDERSLIADKIREIRRK